jgi:predicted transcriptional regulator
MQAPAGARSAVFQADRSRAIAASTWTMDDSTDLIAMTADIVSAYVGANTVAADDLPALIHSVHGALAGVSTGAEPALAAKEPAAPIKRSIMPDYLICLEDGRRFKSLKRHLRSKYDLSPDEYRAKWGLPRDYPMVAPNYAKARSELAKRMGLGRGGAQDTAGET